MKRQYPILLVLLILTLCMSGCFDYNEKLIVKRDGSGTMEVDMWYNKDMNIETDSLSIDLSQEKAEMEREIRAKFTSEKVTLTHYDFEEKDDKKHVNFRVAFPHILDLNELKQFSYNKISYKVTEGNVTYHRDIYMGDDEDTDSNGDTSSNFLSRFVLLMVEEFLENVKFNFELETPAKIKTSNAKSTPSKNKAVWTYRLSEVMYDRKITISATF